MEWDQIVVVQSRPIDGREFRVHKLHHPYTGDKWHAVYLEILPGEKLFGQFDYWGLSFNGNLDFPNRWYIGMDNLSKPGAGTNEALQKLQTELFWYLGEYNK